MALSDIDLSGRVALVTGASRGIGAAVARRLAAAGAHVVALARTQGALEELDDQITENGGACSLLPMDLTKFADLDKLCPTLYDRFGRLDIFIGNAGMLGALTPAHHLEHKDLEKVMRLNFTANVRLIRNLDPLLRASDAGRVLFLTGDMADMCRAYYGAYAASKAALNAFVQCYAAEVLQTNVKVNLFAPDIVDTQMLAEAFPGGFQEAGVRTPVQVAEAMLPYLTDMTKENGEIIIPPSL